MNKHWSDKLAALTPCSPAVEWAREQPSEATAWQTCQRGDWMLWLVGKLDTSAPYSDEHLSREQMLQLSRNALDVITQWAGGKSIDRARLDAAFSKCADIVRQHYPRPPRLP